MTPKGFLQTNEWLDMAYRTALALIEGGSGKRRKVRRRYEMRRFTYRRAHQLVRRALEAGWLHGRGVAGLRECLPKVETPAKPGSPKREVLYLGPSNAKTRPLTDERSD